MKACNLIIEMSFIGLICLALISGSLSLRGDFFVAAGFVGALIFVLLARKLHVLLSTLGTLAISFAFMFIFDLVKQKSIGFQLPSQSVLQIPISSILLSAASISWIVKIVLQEKREPLQREILLPFCWTTGLLIAFALGLYIPLRAIYHLKAGTITEFMHPAIALVLLLAIISTHFTSAGKMRGITLYTVAAMAGLIIKSILMNPKTL